MKRQYALRITRETRTNVTSVHPIVPAPPGARGYRLKYPSARYAESLQLFPTLAAAEEATRHELHVVEIAKKPAPEQLALLRDTMTRLRSEYRLSGRAVCRLAGVNYTTLRAVLAEAIPPNPRIVAKIDLAAPRILALGEALAAVLPEGSGCGHMNKGRGGRPDIRKDRKRAG